MAAKIVFHIEIRFNHRERKRRSEPNNKDRVKARSIGSRSCEGGGDLMHVRGRGFVVHNKAVESVVGGGEFLN